MPNQNNPQNQPNATQFTQDPHVADKHMQYVNQTQLQQQSSQLPTQPFSVQQQQPVQQNQVSQTQASQNQQRPIQPTQTQQYLNPNNFQQVLGQNRQSNPSNQNTTVSSTAAKPTPSVNPDAPLQPMPVQYSPQVMKPVASKVAPTNHEILRLVVYAVPVLAIFILLLRSIDDEDVMWHVRQSLLAQGVWFAVLIILTFLDAPIISTYGPRLWNIACYALLIIAGAQAYNNQKFFIPVIYEAGKSFIDGEK